MGTIHYDYGYLPRPEGSKRRWVFAAVKLFDGARESPRYPICKYGRKSEDFSGLHLQHLHLVLVVFLGSSFAFLQVSLAQLEEVSAECDRVEMQFLFAPRTFDLNRIRRFDVPEL